MRNEKEQNDLILSLSKDELVEGGALPPLDAESAGDHGRAMEHMNPHFMAMALELAEVAAAQEEVPVGAVIVDGQGAVLAATANRMEALRDPTAHAEMMAIREACAALGQGRLEDCDLYVTLEPCAMCAAAISFARIRRLYFGAYDPKGGAVEHGPRFYTQPTCHHRPEIHGGIQEERAGDLLRRFFAARRTPAKPLAAGGV